MRKYLFLAINLYLFISTIIVTIWTLCFGTVAGQVDTGGNYGIFYLATFTVESNLLIGAVALIAAICEIRSMKAAQKDKTTELVEVNRATKAGTAGKVQTETRISPKIVKLYLVAATAGMLTCLTVVLFLAPKRAFDGRNYFDMLIGPMFFFHFFNPVVTALTFIGLTGREKLELKDSLLALIPPAIYAIPYILNVVVLETWPDFYGLTFGGHALLIIPSFLVFCLAVSGISVALVKVRNVWISRGKAR